MENLTISISLKNKAFIRQYAKSQNKSVSELFDEIIESIIKKERDSLRREKKMNQSKDAYAKQVNDFLTGLFNGPQR